MSINIVIKAKKYAKEAHGRIDHRRKYTKHPYDYHLREVATIVSEVTDDEDLIAAAWLHDIVEDTTATHQEIEREFGKKIATLVNELTDVSRPSDGNRERRKAIDRDHLSKASKEAKTIKLADLIDNTVDICKHDEKFAHVFLEEVSLLLNVLKEGDERLIKRLKKAILKGCQKVGHPPIEFDKTKEDFLGPNFFERPNLPNVKILTSLLEDTISAADIALPLRMYNDSTSCKDLESLLKDKLVDVVAVTVDGIIKGYAWPTDMVFGPIKDIMRPFSRDQIVSTKVSLTQVVGVLSRHAQCFLVDRNSTVVGYINKECFESPPVRMWLFGILTFFELMMTRQIEATWPDEEWLRELPKDRQDKAKELLKERHRRQQFCKLIDCLQIADKGTIVLSNERLMTTFGFQSKKRGFESLKRIESLRNNLAHGQSITLYDWPQIVRMTANLEDLVLSFKDNVHYSGV